MMRDPANMHSISEQFIPVPVIAWLAGQEYRLSNELVTQGAVACVDDSMLASSLVWKMFELVVRSAKAQRSHNRQLQQISVTLKAIAGQSTCLRSIARSYKVFIERIRASKRYCTQF
jgi:hypothetical protein